MNDEVTHYCSYSPLRKTIRDITNGKQWVERCRCGNFKTIDCKFTSEESKSPTISVAYFNRDGKPRP